MGFVKERADEIREEQDVELIDRLLSAMAKVIDRHKIVLSPVIGEPGTVNISESYEVSSCPLCGALIGDSTLHARIHIGPPDMQVALLNAL